jgi:RNA polymerase sigma factor (sigma-70 family)
MKSVRKFPDAEVLENIRQSRQLDETIRALYRDHYTRLSRYILANKGTVEDAEDIFQETVVSFLELVQKDRFRGEASIGTFLYAMNRHAWLNELKRKGRALAREEKYERSTEKVQKDSLAFISQREEKQKLNEIIASLGDSCKKILLLYYYEQLPMKEIVLATAYENEQVVRNKKYKCLKQLEEMLNADPSLKRALKSMLHG